MRSILYVGLIALSGVLQPVLSLAAEASHRQAAEALLVTLSVEQHMQVIATQLLDSLLQQQPQLEPHRTVVKAFMEKYLHWGSLKEDMITIYAQAFTEEELQQLLTFYRTPVGKKAMAKIPELAQAGTQLSLMRLQAHQAEFQRMLEADQGKPKAQ